MGMPKQAFFKGITKWKNFLIVFIVPIILLPIVFHFETKPARCAYGVIVIGTYWVLEVMPLAVTSLLPVVLFPMLGVMPVQKICQSYFKDTLMLFLGSLVVAVAVEKWDLHRRIALRALTLVGPQPRWLMLGIMFPCWFLSMWMSNTATTAMMVPILNAILKQIKEARETELNPENKRMLETSFTNNENIEDNALQEKGANGDTNTMEMQTLTKKDVVEIEEEDGPIKSEDKEFIQLAKTFSLCVAFSANIGGVATLTGTPPNIVFKGIAEDEFKIYGMDSGITFANWLVIGLPLSIVCFIFLWGWMQFYFDGKKCFPCVERGEEGSYDNVKKFLHTEYLSLGSMTFAEKMVLGDFVLLAVLWITRNPQFVPGWGALFPTKYITDSVPAILMAVVLFILPSQPPGFLRNQQLNCTKATSQGCRCCGRNLEEDEAISNDEVVVELDKAKKDEYVPLLNWRIVHEKLAWGVILLMGGGFALADACKASGLSNTIAESLSFLSGIPPWVSVLILTIIVAAITNITSNAATTTIFVPIVFHLAIQLGVHPLFFMIPITLSASFAFLLPVGTPPNAIVFSTGYLTIKDMVFGGAVVNIVTVLIMNLCFNAYISPFLGLSVFPEELRKQIDNGTLPVNGTLLLVNQTLNAGYTIVP
ncbi:Na(+)/citrate cotransporter-like isoform X3 [Mytilus californianus]|uniref:Na(+)/citrate cotransporter-like isoform X3 n=1 Tax=Mytilus californianus TaxID=6549 RepID=UPI002246B78D|nr:Na(+)/citrate cotransporter-like isoform X3 [Mytilus californianus]